MKKLILDRPVPMIVRVLLGLMISPVLLLSLTALLILPVHSAFLFCALPYLAVALIEARAGIYSPITLALLTAYTGTTVGAFSVTDPTWLQRLAGFGILGLLVVILLVLLCLRRPVARFYPHWPGFGPLQNALTVTALVCYSGGLVTGLLVPDDIVVFVPLTFAFIGACLTGILSLVTFGPRWHRPKVFSEAGFTFREVEGPEGMENIVRFYSREIVPALKRDRRNKLEHTIDEVTREALAAERRLTGPGHYYFEALDQGKVIGIVAVAVDRPGRLTPIEAAMGITFDPLRRFGPVMEIRRLGIDMEYRFRQEIILGLLKCALDVGLENDVAFVTTYAFSFTQAMYDKIGFKPVTRHGKTGILFGSIMQPMVMNFAHSVVVQEGPDNNSVGLIGNSLHPYLSERWLNRAALRQAWRRKSAQSWELTSEAIELLVVPAKIDPSSPLGTPSP